MPAMVLFEVPGYTGRATIHVNGRHVVPILPRNSQWDRNGSTCTRTQIPLIIAFTITIHKSQGLTLNQAVVNLDTKSINTTLTYVALSRVRHIDSFAIEACPSYNRSLTERTLHVKMRINDACRRQNLPLPFAFKDS